MISIGLDVGRENDPAAVAALTTNGQRTDSHRPVWTALEVGNLELGTPYRALAELVCDLASEFGGSGFPAVVTVDATGIGAAVLEQCADYAPDVHVVGVTIVAGYALNHTGPDSYSVGKHRLTDTLQTAMQHRGLVLPDSDGGRMLGEQLRDFVRKPQASGYVKHEAKGSGHDDLVLATELALWTGDTLHDQQAGIAPA